jgi:hypothetical protein
MENILHFEPNKWHHCWDHNWRDCRLNANCYSYVLNNPDYHWSIPGMGYSLAKAGDYFNEFNAYWKNYSFQEFRSKLTMGAQSDGLIPAEEAEDKEGFYITALFFPPDNYDFHWYRKDDNGLWSHKDGSLQATDKDLDRKVIKDPRNAKASYTVFGGFFLVPRRGVILIENTWQ